MVRTRLWAMDRLVRPTCPGMSASGYKTGTSCSTPLPVTIVQTLPRLRTGSCGVRHSGVFRQVFSPPTAIVPRHRAAGTRRELVARGTPDATSTRGTTASVIDTPAMRTAPCSTRGVRCSMSVADNAMTTPPPKAYSQRSRTSSCTAAPFETRSEWNCQCPIGVG